MKSPGYMYINGKDGNIHVIISSVSSYEITAVVLVDLTNAIISVYKVI